MTTTTQLLRGPLSALLVAGFVACAGTSPMAGPTLSFVPARLADDPIPPDCVLADWRAPWGPVPRVCLEPDAAIEATPGDIRGFRLDDRRFGQETWYFVSVHLAWEFQERIWELLRALSETPLEFPPEPNDPNALYKPDRPYAVLVDRELSAIQPAIAINATRPSMVAVTQDLSQAETLAYAWGAPVTRVLSAEIVAQPLIDVSMVQLIANPNAYIGKRISVQGYLSPLHSLYLSREHADANDFSSSIEVLLLDSNLQSEAFANALFSCDGEWVSIDGFVDSHYGLPELSRIERVSWKGSDCWPLTERKPN